MIGQLELVESKHKFNRDDMTIIAMLRCLSPQPTTREMARYIGKVESTIRYKLAWLQGAGYIIREGKRAIRVTQKGEEVYPEFVVIVKRETEE